MNTADYDLDDEDADVDVDEDDDVDEAEDDADEDDEDDEEEVETWQVKAAGEFPLKVRLFLTSGVELPRLARISSSSELEQDLAGLASRRHV